MKHTIGPWKVSCKFGGGSEIKDFHTITDSDNRLFVALADTQASANLIAAAPEMLEALEKALPVLRLNKKNATADIVESAIKKARGEK